jgi:hypothetical protein
MSSDQDYLTNGTLKTVMSYVSLSDSLAESDDMENIQLAGFSVHRQDRTAASGKDKGWGSVSICQ